MIGKGTNVLLADGVTKAVEHYKNLDKTMAELKNAVIHAIKMVASDKEIQVAEKTKEPNIKTQDIIKKEVEKPEEDLLPGPKEIIAGIIDKLDTGKGISYSIVVEAAQKAGIDPHIAESGIKDLMYEGRCYELKIGVLRKA
jgi:hypothetical protein